MPEGAGLAVTLVTALVAGLARGFSGFGGALIFIPVASASLGPTVAAPLLMLVDNVLAVPMVPRAWARLGRAGLREIGTLVAGALLGAPLGTWVLTRGDPAALRWAMCTLVLAMLVLLASGWRYRGAERPWISVSVGALSGLFSGTAQMGGPPVVAYWLGGAIPAERVRANIVLFFAASGLISFFAYLAAGLLDTALLGIALTVAPAYATGLWLGARLFPLASEAQFRRACLGLIGLAGLIGLPVWDRLW
ncbi:sulfite exporter TauE/SafE family protein [Pseudoroseomonas globiformis]|uniref:Probable membrane transporter protein n=1 Tax=Teichococcus globiformis TaxID=2307229 RepID=A0ABV7G498_9PROT